MSGLSTVDLDSENDFDLDSVSAIDTSRSRGDSYISDEDGALSLTTAVNNSQVFTHLFHKTPPTLSKNYNAPFFP